MLLTAAARTHLLSLKSMWKRGAVFLAPKTSQPYPSAHHLDERWIAACKAAKGRHRRACNCRHTGATLGLMAGQTPAFLAGQLGHSVTMLLSTHARWLPGDRDREERAKLEPILPLTTEMVR